MPNIKVPVGKLKGFEALPPGTYQLRLDGFEPKWSKKKDSINLQPKLIVINNQNQELNDGKHRAFDNLNSQAGWVLIDFCHAFGERMTGEEDGVPMEQWTSPDVGMPGDFQENPSFPGDPEKWTYVGPLLGRVATVDIINQPGYNNANKVQAVINKYYCQVQGCTHSHSEGLA